MDTRGTMIAHNTYVDVKMTGGVYTWAAWLQKFYADKGITADWIDPAKFHVTLTFLGDVPLEDVPRIKEVVHEFTGRQAVALAFDVVGTFFTGYGNKRPLYIRPREYGGLQRLYDDVTTALKAENLAGNIKRKHQFIPHLTLGWTLDNPHWYAHEMVAALANTTGELEVKYKEVADE
jgi:2'-5' RNA ligase